MARQGMLMVGALAAICASTAVPVAAHAHPSQPYAGRDVPILTLNSFAELAFARDRASDDERAAQAQARQTAPRATASQASEPPLEPTPRARCGPGSRPETGMQGRVTAEDHASGRAAEGFACNAELVGSYTTPTAEGTVGGFKVERYTDAAGHDCAYYDTTLLFPLNLFDQTAGVSVLDMSDPTEPRLTASLVTPAMLSPHESLVLSRERGVLVAVSGNAAFYPGIVDVYDISQDCRRPVLKGSAPTGIFGHESGMAPDGRTFYSASPATATIVAVDISNPSTPIPIWTGGYDSHGLSVSNDGNRIYVAGIGSGLIILDTSEVQSRVPNPTVREVARLRWRSMSIPQNAIPFTRDGHPYLLEIDEFGSLSQVGAGRIIDIGDERNPFVVSNLRLEVHQPENFDQLRGDPGTFSPIQGYAGHYCNVPTRADPEIAACSMILSGLRVFDIRDPLQPREVAYFNAPVRPRTVSDPSNYAMSSPSFVSERNEVWYSDGFSGFYAVRLTNGAWNSAAPSQSQGDDAASTEGGDEPQTQRSDGDVVPVSETIEQDVTAGDEIVSFSSGQLDGSLAFTGLDLRALLALGLALLCLGVAGRRLAGRRAPGP